MRNGNDRLWYTALQAILDKRYDEARTALDELIFKHQDEAVDVLPFDHYHPSVDDRIRTWNGACTRRPLAEVLTHEVLTLQKEST